MSKSINNKIKFNQLLKIIENNLSINNFELAIDNLLKLIELEPKNYAAISELGTCFAKKGDFYNALLQHQNALSLAPGNVTIITNVGLDLMHLGKFNEAVSYFKKSIEINPSDPNSHLGLCNLYNNFGDYQNLIRASTVGLSYFPSNEQFHIFIACGLMGVNKFEDAKYSLDTALILNPKSLEAKFNLAYIETKIGSITNSINIYEDLLSQPDIEKNDLNPLIKFNLSFEYLKKGNLKIGWDYYESGFDFRVPFHMRRRPNRVFKAPKWTGQSLDKSTILVWREQGIGDEILFLSMLQDLAEIAPKIILECESRLVKICKNTFPNIIVRSAPLDNIQSQIKEDYDFQIPIGSLGRFFRKSELDIKSISSYLKPNENEEIELIKSLTSSANKLKIGICWRSGVLNTQRNENYLPLSEWDDIFKLNNCDFVNLQYGECEAELIEAENKFKIKIIRDSRIDLKIDLDIVFSMISNLDLVITPATAVSSMSFSIGTPTLVFKQANAWDNLGQETYPWSSSAKVFPFDSKHLPKNALKEISIYIKNNYY
jgi:tetratricopeptide (TPR) repeat protein